ncbi:tumor necrosis factor receptor superfamily member 6-like protein [Amazona aestiva]|uniref:Tumor necrosis factor receptor superfamily member 6-like protein n=1 Tax=Amazona aestiva TaxID=12930 RepID=A0A0Q3MP95_AMAAE|nr:tumor necrosis factor receptor superfamily member 6-like protein [Amazona aestiva]
MRKVVALIIETLCKNETEAIMRRAYNKLITRKIIAKRHINCNWDEYSLGGQCCKKCEPGFVKNVSCPTDTSKHCVSCENGKEYIDHINDLAKCLRCASCDSVFDVDLSSYVADIVEQMTYEETLKFVRYHRVPETKIDEIIHDNSDTSERKIHFFQAWLQRHGMNGTYEALIRSLRNLQMCAVADKIERKLQEAVSNSE